MAPATTPASCTAISSTSAGRRSWRRLRAPWATGCRRRSPPSSRTLSASVVALAGDGCLLMTGQELATAVQYGLPHHRHRRQQRHVRHHPHAPGTPLPGPGCRNDAGQSGLRGSRPQLRRRRRAGGGDRGLLARAAAARWLPRPRHCSSCASIPRPSARDKRFRRSAESRIDKPQPLAPPPILVNTSLNLGIAALAIHQYLVRLTRSYRLQNPQLNRELYLASRVRLWICRPSKRTTEPSGRGPAPARSSFFWLPASFSSHR